MNDQRTEHLKLPLPCNSLEIDLPRIQQAFIALDQKISAIDTLLSSDDVTLDQVQELVNSIKSNRSLIQALVDGWTVLESSLTDTVETEIAQMRNSLETVEAGFVRDVRAVRLNQLLNLGI